MSEAKRIDHEEFDVYVTWGRSLGYWWRAVDAGVYQLVRPDESIAMTFGPVHEDDRAYFDGLCGPPAGAPKVN